ncbi:MAG: class II fructose-bisphosphate aldolase [Candidatus Micrarchaeota archaeon]
MAKPISGEKMFKALKDKNCIVMAVNTRVTKGVVHGIMRAAKDADAAVIFELAKSESDLKGGYTGITPKMFGDVVCADAEKVGFDVWALHADHITIKKGTPEELVEIKKLIDAQIEAGYTSFAIDASFLFNLEGENVHEQLAKNIEVTTELARYIEKKKGTRDFGLEVEVGEIGKKDASGLVLTSVEEAVEFIGALKKNEIDPDVLAIANGSSHGNIYKDGKMVAQVSINIPRTKEIAGALRAKGWHVRIAQHGITGTPLEFIASHFPKGDVIKGNVGTFWQNIVWETFKVFEPELLEEIKEWTKKTYGEEATKKGITSDEEIFGKYGKNAIKPFYGKIYAMKKETERALEARAYADALVFFRAFGAEGSAEIVRKS